MSRLLGFPQLSAPREHPQISVRPNNGALIHEHGQPCLERRNKRRQMVRQPSTAHLFQSLGSLATTNHKIGRFSDVLG